MRSEGGKGGDRQREEGRGKDFNQFKPFNCWGGGGEGRGGKERGGRELKMGRGRKKRGGVENNPKKGRRGGRRRG